jgi:hypothetical protein
LLLETFDALETGVRPVLSSGTERLHPASLPARTTRCCSKGHCGSCSCRRSEAKRAVDGAVPHPRHSWRPSGERIVALHAVPDRRRRELASPRHGRLVTAMRLLRKFGSRCRMTAPASGSRKRPGRAVGRPDSSSLRKTAGVFRTVQIPQTTAASLGKIVAFAWHAPDWTKEP